MGFVTVGFVLEGFEVLADGFRLCAFGGCELDGEGHEGTLFHFHVSRVGVRVGVFRNEDVRDESVPVAICSQRRLLACEARLSLIGVLPFILTVVDVDYGFVDVLVGRWNVYFGVDGPGRRGFRRKRYALG